MVLPLRGLRPDRACPSHRDAIPLEYRRDGPDRTWLLDLKAHVMSAAQIRLDGLDAAFGGRRETAVVFGNLHNVREYGAGAGQWSRSLAAEKHLADCIATD